MASAQGEKIPVWVWLALAVLVLLALAVIFVLPKVVQEYELPLVQRTAPDIVTNQAAGSTPVPSTPQIAPFDEAQRTRLRREAQDALASLLNRQTALDEAGVTLWAAEPYAEAIEAAERGDGHYRNGEFAEAAEAYREGDALLADIESGKQALFDRLMAEGGEALEQSDAETALARFELATQVDPTSQEADQGLRRANVLDEVEALLTDAEALQQDSQLGAAAERIDEALQLDPEHERAIAMRSDNQQRQLDAEFADAMSEGFALLQQGQAEAAITTFERARQLKPSAGEVDAAISQARAEQTLDAIAALRRQAGEQEETEQWEAAVASYDQVLALDGNLVFAQEGRNYAAKRLQLDTLLKRNIDDPVRLSDQAAYDEAQELLRIGRGLIRDEGGVGPRLTEQLEQTETLLAQAQQPVTITLFSDSQTDVVVYQVGRLGTFSETSLELRPGRYVAVGTRPGYRDVREEFLVGFGSQLESVTIRCNELIAAQ